MDRYEEFEKLVKKSAEQFIKKAAGKGSIRIVSHLDADGICAASILIKALLRKNIQYSLSIVQQLKEEILQEFAKEEYLSYVFTDLGSGQIENIKKYLGERDIYILDHHTINKGVDDSDIIHVNPHLCSINGNGEISGAGVVYLFAKAIEAKNEDMAHIALVGAIGDIQDKGGFLHLNKKILDTALKNKKIEMKKSLRFFGAETKPLFKLLAYSTDPFIPGVSGSESKAIQFLNDLDINPRVDKKFRKLNNLAEKEMESLISAIIIKRQNEEDPQDILGDIYILKEEDEGNPTRDAREFSTLLNACGRMNRASVGIGTCLGDKKSKKEAFRVLLEYKREIMNALRWYEEKKDSKNIVREKGYMLINAGNEILGTIIGTLASIISYSEETPKNTYILGVARSQDGTTKASLRFSGRDKEGVDLKSVVEDIVEISGGESGGHDMAAGAVIPIELEQEFLDAAKKVLSRKVIEEVVVSD
ncbi:DHH family phosphoesterase [Candidatus Woesearchaeota archaeon]|nr:DHH family phosphoesterase [Candidatus Woesearchaeota archaeon]